MVLRRMGQHVRVSVSTFLPHDFLKRIAFGASPSEVPVGLSTAVEGDNRMTDQTPAPGWYPAPHANNEQRYWDGAQWLEPAPAIAQAPTVAITAGEPTTASIAPLSEDPPKKSKKRSWIIGGSIAAGIIVIGGIGSALGAGNKVTPSADKAPTTAAAEPSAEEAPPEPVLVLVPDVTGMTAADAYNAISHAGLTPPAITSFADPLAKVISTSPAANEDAEEGSTVAFTLEEKPKLTLGQQNAIDKAQSYLSFAGFSRTGLIDQLEFEGFGIEDATFGADNAGADWNAECAQKAQSYIDLTSFSRQGLYDQLAFEGFLPAEIEFGLAAVGY